VIYNLVREGDTSVPISHRMVWAVIALMQVAKLRTAWGSRSALTATNNSLTPTSMPASGCKRGNSSHRFLDLFAIGSSELPVGCPRHESKANSQSRSSAELTSVVTGGQTLDEFLEDFPTVKREAAIRALEHAKELVVSEL